MATTAKRSSKKTTARRKTAKKAATKKVAKNARRGTPAKKAHRRMSPQARKNLVAKHLREMLDEKNRRAAQTPAWQQIVHHDHPAPLSTPRVPEAVEAVPADERGPVGADDRNRDRGGN